MQSSGSLSPRLFYTTFILVTVSLFLAVSALIVLLADQPLLSGDNLLVLAVAVMLQILVVVLSAEAWLASLQVQPAERYTGRMVLVSALFNACKYVPGKIWGLAIRAAVTSSHHGGRIKAQNTLIDQLAMLHAGVLLLVFLVGLSMDMVLRIPFYLLALATVPACNAGLRWGAQWLGRGRGHYWRKLGELLPEPCQQYPQIVLRFVLIWLILAASLGLCLSIVIVDIFSTPMVLLKITVLSYFVGFAAFFMPGGIGARDGAMYLFLQGRGDNQEVLLATLLHRAAVTIADVLLALPALPYLKRLTGAKS